MPETSPSASLHDYTAHFQMELDRLNPAQKEAVKNIEGPVLVVAGPGTGKTHILSARIGRILLETDTLPNNILCLTFTDAGTHAMRQRLLSLIGPEAHRVHIFTFHSFCNSVIQDNLELFGRHELEPLSDLERIEIIRSILDDLDINHPLKKGKRDEYFYEKKLSDLFQRMKAEDWSPDFINDKVYNYLESLPMREDYIYKVNSKTFSKGDLKEWKITEQKEKMNRLQSAVALFPVYVDRLVAAHRYDFEDMILWVLRAFENNEALLRTYQEKYLYFLIDEFQDTNGAQNNIIQKLITYWESPNIFIVGDDDQSIYEFQGARLKNLLDFYYLYKEDLRLVLLQDNYRSSQNILDSSKAVIDNNHKRIITELTNLDKLLRAQNIDFAKSTIQPAIKVYENRMHEQTDVVTQIEQLQKEGVALAEIAIIYAKHRQAKEIITLLEKKNIPYHTKRNVNVLDLPIIQNLKTILRYLSLEVEKPFSGEHLLFKILHTDFLKIKAVDLATLSLYMAQNQYEQKLKWRELIANEKQLTALKLKHPERILAFSNLLNDLITDYHNLSVPAFVERLVNRSGLLFHVIHHQDKSWYLQVLNTFFDFIKSETDKNPRMSLDRLLTMFDSMDANRLAMGIQKTVYADEGVKLITAHSSKGLEFRYVFIIDCVKDEWEPRNSSGAFRFTFPDTLTMSGEEDALEARRRLFYVAMTRAKEHLYLSYSKKKKTGKPLLHTRFIDEIIQDTNLEIQEIQPDENFLIEAQTLLLLEAKQPQVVAPDKATINALLEGFKLSVSSMNRYLSCPIGFYYEHVLKIPSVSSQAASYGTALHNALNRLFDKMTASEDKSFPPDTAFVRFFEGEMSRQRANFPRKNYSKRLAMGKQYLKEFYAQYVDQWHKKTQTELSIRNVEVKGVPIKGVIDKLEIHKDFIHIVDYKSGSHQSKKTQGPTKSNPIGGLYWRQLVFYKILYQAYSQDKIVNSGEIVYLDPDDKGFFPNKKITFKVEDVALVQELIVDTYQKIMRHDFFTGCGEKNCQWCTFVEQNKAIDSFVDNDAESLDD